MKKLVIAWYVFVLFLGMSDRINAAPILDQSQEQWNGGGWNIYAQRSFAQTFTCGISNQLSHVDVLLDTWEGSPDYPSTFSIVGVVSGVPSGAPLASVNASGFVLGWNTVDFSSEGLFLAAGTQYGILVSNDDPDPDASPSLGMGFDYDNNYNGGMMWYWTAAGGWSNDFTWAPPGETDGVFRTWMIPEPSTWLLLVFSGLYGVIRTKKKLAK